MTGTANRLTVYEVQSGAITTTKSLTKVGYELPISDTFGNCHQLSQSKKIEGPAPLHVWCTVRAPSVQKRALIQWPCMRWASVPCEGLQWADADERLFAGCVRSRSCSQLQSLCIRRCRRAGECRSSPYIHAVLKQQFKEERAWEQILQAHKRSRYTGRKGSY